MRCEDQGCSSCSDHEVVGFRVLRGRNRTINSILRKKNPNFDMFMILLEEVGNKVVYAVIQQDRERLEKWTERNLMKFSKEQCTWREITQFPSTG